MQVTYHQTHSFTDSNGVAHTLTTQLYKSGIYGILDNDSSMQLSFEPPKLQRLEKKLIKQEKEGKISKLTFGLAITVSDNSGLWEIVSREYASSPEDAPPFKIFIRKNKTYACRRPLNGVLYHFSVHKITKDKNDLRESLVEFTVMPECKELAIYAIGDNLYRANAPIFQQTIEKKPIAEPSTN